MGKHDIFLVDKNMMYAYHLGVYICVCVLGTRACTYDLVHTLVCVCVCTFQEDMCCVCVW